MHGFLKNGEISMVFQIFFFFTKVLHISEVFRIMKKILGQKVVLKVEEIYAQGTQ